MQDLSYYDFCPTHSFRGWQFQFHFYTFENVYTLSEHGLMLKESEESMEITGKEFQYAGNQYHVPGTFSAVIRCFGGNISVKTQVHLPKTIRSVKLSVLHVPAGDIVNLREGHVTIPPEGLIYTYPSGWRGLFTPLAVIKNQNADNFFFARSLDTYVREKRFAIIPHGHELTIELIHEESGAKMTCTADVPVWEFGTTDSENAVYEMQKKHIENSFHLTPWEERPDVPQWLRKISLVAAIHMEHWTGYVFNTYNDVLQIAEWLKDYINPENVLLYLPGWDGRYYWNYGHYQPVLSLGGIESFRNMLLKLREMGYHVALMFGMNIASRKSESFEIWGNSSLSKDVSGIPQYSLVDWDGSRHYKHGYNAMLSIGAPHWQSKLLEEIVSIYEIAGFDAVYLDISAAWINEQLYDDYQGIQDFIAALRQQLPSDTIIVGEGWYDAISAVTPVVQSGHTDGTPHYHDAPYSPFFDSYCRCFGHLCLGDFGRGSTGVHELGHNKIQTVPYRKGIIPTISFVEDTLKNAKEKLLQVIETAEQYRKDFI